MRTSSFFLLSTFLTCSSAICAPPGTIPDQVTMSTEGKRPMNGALSPDGRTMAVNVVGGEIYLCDALTGEVKTALSGHSQWVWLEFSPDSKLLASGGSQDGQVRLWDVATGKELALLADFDTQVSMVRFSPDGKTIACSQFVLSDPDRDGIITFWDVATQTQLATFTTKNGLTDIAYSPDGKLLASAEYAKQNIDLDPLSEVTIWNVQTGRVVKRIPNRCGTMSRLAFARDGKTLAVAGYNAQHVLQASDRIALYDTATWTHRRAMFGHKKRIFGIAFFADGKRLMSSGSDGVLFKWNVATAAKEAVLATRTGDTCQLTISADQQRFAIVAKSAEVIRVDAVKDAPETLPRQRGGISPHGVAAIRFSVDGKTLAAARGGVLHYWDATNSTDLPPVKVSDSRIRAIAPNLLTVLSGSGTMTAWDVLSRKQLYSVTASRTLSYKMIVSPDGRLITAAAPERVIRVWDMKSGRLWAATPPQSEVHLRLAFTPDSRKLISGERSKEGRIVIWDLPNADAAEQQLADAAPDNQSDKQPEAVPAKVTAALKQAEQLIANGRRTTATLQEAIVPVLADLPAIVPHTGKQQPKWHRLTVNRDGSRFAVVRFKSPLKEDADLGWVFHAPQLAGWYILPVEDSMKGFKSFQIERDVRMQGVKFPWNARLYFQHLKEGNIKPGKEYMLWFRFKSDKPVELKLCIHLSPAGTHKDVKTSTEIAKSIGLKTPLVYRTVTEVPLKINRVLNHGKNIGHLAVSPNGRYLASVDYQNLHPELAKTKVWDLKSGEMLRSLRGGRIAFSPDGKMLAITLNQNEPRSIVLYETETGKLLHTFEGAHLRDILCLEFSPDGRRLASGGASGIVALWDVKTGKQNWTPFNFK